MEQTIVVDDSVIEFFGRHYCTEPRELRARVRFADYLELSLRAWPSWMFHHAGKTGPHLHECACGTRIVCDRRQCPLLSEPPARCRKCAGSGNGGLMIVLEGTESAAY